MRLIDFYLGLNWRFTQALSLKPSLKSVRVLTLPHMEFEFCNVYRGTLGKTLPLLQRHPDAVVILWKPNDYDHVFFVTLSQLIPCLKQKNADHGSMIVFWSEGSRTRPSTSPDVGLDYTDEPVPLPSPNVPPPMDGTGNDDDMPGPSGYQDPVVPDENMPYDDPGDDSPDLAEPEAVFLDRDRDRDLLVIKTAFCEPGPNYATATSRATSRSSTDCSTSEASAFSDTRSHASAVTSECSVDQIFGFASR